MAMRTSENGRETLAAVSGEGCGAMPSNRQVGGTGWKILASSGGSESNGSLGCRFAEKFSKVAKVPGVPVASEFS